MNNGSERFEKTRAAGFEVLRSAKPVPYLEGLKLQHTLVRERIEGLRPDTLVLLEHEPVITLGRNADTGGVTASPQLLAELGIAVHRVERGGQATYHGPGQAVLYPILDLKKAGLGVKRYVELLEEVMILAAGKAGVKAWRIAGKPGIFCEEGKLGAIGVAVTRGISFHGLALNACPDLGHFRLIIPCGMAGVPPASLESAGGTCSTVESVQEFLLCAWAGVFGPSGGRGP